MMRFGKRLTKAKGKSQLCISQMRKDDASGPFSGAIAALQSIPAKAVNVAGQLLRSFRNYLEGIAVAQIGRIRIHMFDCMPAFVSGAGFDVNRSSIRGLPHPHPIDQHRLRELRACIGIARPASAYR